jgi:hypothetical protein
MFYSDWWVTQEAIEKRLLTAFHAFREIGPAIYKKKEGPKVIQMVDHIRVDQEMGKLSTGEQVRRFFPEFKSTEEMMKADGPDTELVWCAVDFDAGKLLWPAFFTRH